VVDDPRVGKKLKQIVNAKREAYIEKIGFNEWLLLEKGMIRVLFTIWCGEAMEEFCTERRTAEALMKAFHDKGFTLPADGSIDNDLHLGSGLEGLVFPKEKPPEPPPRLTAKQRRENMVNDAIDGVAVVTAEGLLNLVEKTKQERYNAMKKAERIAAKAAKAVLKAAEKSAASTAAAAVATTTTTTTTTTAAAPLPAAAADTTTAAAAGGAETRKRTQFRATADQFNLLLVLYAEDDQCAQPRAKSICESEDALAVGLNKDHTLSVKTWFKNRRKRLKTVGAAPEPAAEAGIAPTVEATD
jgi:hypothetical protein